MAKTKTITKAQRDGMQRLTQVGPAQFREKLLIDAGQGKPKPFASVLDDWQAEDFQALDAAWLRTISREPPIMGQRQRAYLERPRGHSKTTDIAVSATWALACSGRKISGVVVSGDKDQAGLIRDAIDGLVRMNSWLVDILDVTKDEVRNKVTGSFLKILSSDAPSSYGLTPDFVICDELTHWPKRDLWDSLFSSAAKRAHCLMLVIANAGFRESWQWANREVIREDPAWYFRRLENSQATWISAENLDEQRRLLPDKVFRRLWANEWAEGAGDALDTRDIDAAVRLAGEMFRPEPNGWVYLAGLDIGLKHDATALVVIGKHVGYTEKRVVDSPKLSLADRVLIDFGALPAPKGAEFEYIRHEGTGLIRLATVKIWRPVGGERVNLEKVEREILRLNKIFKLACVSFDPWQAEYLSQRLQRQQLRMLETSFTSGSLKEMASATLDAFQEGTIELYEENALLADLRSLRIVERASGYRLESPKQSEGEGTRHGDTATALSIALRAARSINHQQIDLSERQLVLYS